MLAERYWKSRPQRVKAPYAKMLSLLICLPSTTEHEEFCGNPGGPPPKAKDVLSPIVNKYREGKVKRTPGGELKEPETISPTSSGSPRIG